MFSSKLSPLGHAKDWNYPVAGATNITTAATVTAITVFVVDLQL